MFTKSKWFVGLMGMMLAASAESKAGLISSISYDHGVSVSRQFPNEFLSQSLVGTTLPVSQTLTVGDGGPSASATYNFTDNGTTATLQITTTESIDGAGQNASEGTPGDDSFSFSQPVAYHFLFQDSATPGASGSAGASFVPAFASSTIFDSSLESDGTLRAGLDYLFSEQFQLNELGTNAPTTATATTSLLFTFTAIPEPSAVGLLATAGVAMFRRRRLRSGTSTAVDFDALPRCASASRLLCLDEGTGYLYAGNNQTSGLYAVNELGSQLNGGEQILVEGGSQTVDGTAGSFGIQWFNTSGGVSTMVVSSGVALDTRLLPFEMIIASGPGMGEARTMVSRVENSDGTYTITFDHPWAVNPTTGSVVEYGNITVDMTVFQNTLQGDGLQSYFGSTCGTELEGANIVVDDNDISKVCFGLSLYNSGGTGSSQTAHLFNLYADNSIHAVIGGVFIAANWDDSSTATNTPWFIGNVFRQNSFADCLGYPAIYIGTNAGSTHVNASQLLMNIFDSNTMSGIAPAFEFLTNTPSGVGGVVDTILWNDFASGNGTLGTAGIVIGSTDTDSPYLDGVNDQWENYFELVLQSSSSL